MDLSTLSPDEGFILHDECICTTITMRGKCQVWLTNKNIILNKEKILSKSEEKYPLSELKVIDGSSQIMVERNCVTLAFINGIIQLDFMNENSAIRFADNVNHIVTGEPIGTIAKTDDSYILSTVSNAISSTISTIAGGFASGIGRVGNMKSEIDRQQNGVVTKRCVGCGAPLSGMSGDSVVCSYCDTRQNL